MQQGDDSKGVQVGTRIAITAEPDDDISSLELPAEDKAAAPKKPKEESSPAPKKEATKPSPKPASSGSSKAAGGNAKKQTYPPAAFELPDD